MCFCMHWLIHLYNRPIYSCRNWALEGKGQSLNLKLGFSCHFKPPMFHFPFCAWFLRPHLALKLYILWLGISYSQWRVPNPSSPHVVNSNHVWKTNGLDRCHFCFVLNRCNDGSSCWQWLLSLTSAQTDFYPQEAEAQQTSVPRHWHISAPRLCTFYGFWDITVFCRVSWWYLCCNQAFSLWLSHRLRACALRFS